MLLSSAKDLCARRTMNGRWAHERWLWGQKWQRAKASSHQFERRQKKSETLLLQLYRTHEERANSRAELKTHVLFHFFFDAKHTYNECCVDLLSVSLYYAAFLYAARAHAEVFTSRSFISLSLPLSPSLSLFSRFVQTKRERIKKNCESKNNICWWARDPLENPWPPFFLSLSLSLSLPLFLCRPLRVSAHRGWRGVAIYS